MDLQLLFVRTYTFLKLLWDLALKQSVKSTTCIINSFSEDIYYIYTGSHIPISVATVKEHPEGSVLFTYKYNKDTKTITCLLNTEGEEREHTSNIIEAKLFLNSTELYDLTDFFDTTKCIGLDFPPIRTWIGFWGLESGIYLDPTANLTLTVQMMDGSDESFDIWAEDPSSLTKWKKINAPLSLHRQ